MSHSDDEYFILHLKGEPELKPVVPWWVRPEHLRSTVAIRRHCVERVYSRISDQGIETAFVEWRSGTAYLTILMIGQVRAMLPDQVFWEKP